jgi:hypothetical protein
VENKFKIVTRSYNRVEELPFTSQKTLYQWEYRYGHNFRGNSRGFVRYVDRGKGWEPFMMVGKQLCTLTDLRNMARELSGEAQSIQPAKRSAVASKTGDNPAHLT